MNQYILTVEGAQALRMIGKPVQAGDDYDPTGVSATVLRKYARNGFIQPKGGEATMDGRTAPRHTNDSTIARLRIERGLTQTQLARLVGCPQQTITRWETGQRNPGMKSLVKLARALGCTLDELVE